MSDPRTVERLTGWVRGFARRRVAVLGDLVADEFLFGDIARVSREAPVLILEEQRVERVPGGGANSVANLSALGAVPVPVGALGRDDAGRGLRSSFRAARIPTGGLVDCADYATPAKRRILAGGVHTRRQQIVRVDRGARHGELPPSARRTLRSRLREALKGAEGLLIADYGYGSAAPEIVEPLLPGLRRRGVPVTVDSRGRIARFRHVTACTPNQEEVERALGVEPLDDAHLAAAGRRLLRRTGNEALVVTRGARGMTLFRPRRPPLEIPAWGTDEVADVTGAGDTVIAVMTLALIVGAEAEDAARLANYAAGIVVTKMGTATVSGAELIEAVRRDRG